MSIRAKRLASKAAILIVCGLAAFATGAIVVQAATSAQIAKKKKRSKARANFRIRAELTQPMSPGKVIPLKMSFANNRTQSLWVTRLAITLKVDKAHAAAGCSIRRDYRLVQLPKRFFPYKISKAKRLKGKKKLLIKYRSVPAKKAGRRPALIMLKLPRVNQDACKGATLTLSYTSRASTKKPRKFTKIRATR